MFYRGTGKADHGFRVSIIMDADSRFILGYSIGTYHKEKPKKGEKFSELEKAAIAMAEKTLAEYGVVDEEGNALRIVDPGKNTRCSAFFGSLAAEYLLMISRTQTENYIRLRYGKMWHLNEDYPYSYKRHGEK